MEVKATVKFARMSPKKILPMVRTLRGMKVVDAMVHLQFHPSKSATLIYKLLKSALGNAVNNYNLKEDNLKIKLLTVDTGPTLKRYWFRSHGAADPLLKRSAHISVVLDEIKPTLVKKPVAKPATTTKSVADTTDTKADVTTETMVKPKVEAPRPKVTQGLKKVFTRRTTNK